MGFFPIHHMGYESLLMLRFVTNLTNQLLVLGGGQRGGFGFHGNLAGGSRGSPQRGRGSGMRGSATSRGSPVKNQSPWRNPMGRGSPVKNQSPWRTRQQGGGGYRGFGRGGPVGLFMGHPGPPE